MRDEAISPATDHPLSGITVQTLEDERPVAERAPQSPSRKWLRWLALAAILIAGNLANALSWHFAIPIDSGIFSISLALGLYLTPGWSEWRRSRVVAPGWRMRWRPTALALAAGLLLAIPSVLFLALASAHGGVGYTPIPSMPVSSLLVRELIEIPLLTAFVEELVFRQFVFRLFAQKNLLLTVLTNAGIFTLWHVVVNARTILATTLAASPLLDIGSYAGSMATIFAAGVVFALVRWRTGSFVYSAITHWLLLALITLAVWAL